MINIIFNLLRLSTDRASAVDPPINIIPINFAKGTGIPDLIKGFGWVINTLFFVAGTSAVIYFIYSGIMYISAGGNPDAAKKGQQGLLYATIGIIVVAIAYFLVTTIADVASTATN